MSNNISSCVSKSCSGNSNSEGLLQAQKQGFLSSLLTHSHDTTSASSGGRMSVAALASIINDSLLLLEDDEDGLFSGDSNDTDISRQYAN
jgi:hypothetical protein